jgi:predicted enzyme related to lactoylglutathione lyase
MITNVDGINLNSENAGSLADFYKDTVGLQLEDEAVMGEDQKFYWFKIGDSNLYIIDHSEVSGKNPNPQRMFFNLEVDSFDSEMERLDKAGVKKIQDKYHIESYGWVATYEDPDGNYFQIVQVRPN